MRRTLNSLTTKLAGRVKLFLNILTALMESAAMYVIRLVASALLTVLAMFVRWRPVAEAPTPKPTTAATDNRARTDAQHKNANRVGQPNGAAKQNTERNRRMKRTLNALTTKLAGRVQPFLNIPTALMMALAVGGFALSLWMVEDSMETVSNAHPIHSPETPAGYAEVAVPYAITYAYAGTYNWQDDLGRAVVYASPHGKKASFHPLDNSWFGTGYAEVWVKMAPSRPVNIKWWRAGNDEGEFGIVVAERMRTDTKTLPYKKWTEIKSGGVSGKLSLFNKVELAADTSVSFSETRTGAQVSVTLSWKERYWKHEILWVSALVTRNWYYIDSFCRVATAGGLHVDPGQGSAHEHYGSEHYHAK